MTVEVDARVERWPLREPFTIARDTYREVEVVVVRVRDGEATGHGECRPYAHFGESARDVVRTIAALAPDRTARDTREDLLRTLPAGAARNALDAAWLDLEAKQSGVPAHVLLGVEAPGPVASAFTLGIAAPDAMAEAARRAASRPVLKVKVGDHGVVERVRAVREAAPHARLIVDANEAWDEASLERRLDALAALGVELVEQPLPAGRDEALSRVARPVPVCADESCRGDGPLAALTGRYDAVNLKLDKTGGVTAAARRLEEARAEGFRVMIGCMVSTSLAVAPAFLLAAAADFHDLDGPLLLARDREPGVRDDGTLLHAPPRALWG